MVWWTAFYDSVYEHPERPEQRIIENDDLLDKWVEDKAKEAEERSRKNSSKYKNAPMSALDHDEVIIFGEEIEEEIEEEYEEIIEEY